MRSSKIVLTFQFFVSLVEVEASFPYKDVSIRHGEDPRSYYDISTEELGRYVNFCLIFVDFSRQQFLFPSILWVTIGNWCPFVKHILTSLSIYLAKSVVASWIHFLKVHTAYGRLFHLRDNLQCFIDTNKRADQHCNSHRLKIL